MEGGLVEEGWAMGEGGLVEEDLVAGEGASVEGALAEVGFVEAVMALVAV
jgi:hypothetical protein